MINKLKNQNFICLIPFLLIFACSKESGRQLKSSSEGEENSQITYQLTSLDTVFLDAALTSQVGYFFLSDLGVHFADRIKSKIFSFSWTGDLMGEYLGTGDGPTSQNGLHGIVYQNHRFYILSDVFMSIFDSTYALENRSQLEWGGVEPYEEMLNHPTPDMFGLYEISWISRMVNLPFAVLENGNGFILPVMMTHPKLNGYWTTEYYEQVANLGRFDAGFKLIQLGGKRSEKYLNYEYLPNFDYTHLIRKGDNLIVSFPIDHELYVYDLELQFLKKFGVPGKQMKTDYIPTQTLEEAESQWEMDFNQFGHYDHLHYDEDSKLLFRSYIPKGRDSGRSRIQVYKGENLVGDFEVPLRFKVIGSHRGEFYADGIVDEENEKLGFFKFTLNER